MLKPREHTALAPNRRAESFIIESLLSYKPCTHTHTHTKALPDLDREDCAADVRSVLQALAEPSSNFYCTMDLLILFD